MRNERLELALILGFMLLAIIGFSAPDWMVTAEGLGWFK